MIARLDSFFKLAALYGCRQKTTNPIIKCHV